MKINPPFDPDPDNPEWTERLEKLADTLDPDHTGAGEMVMMAVAALWQDEVVTVSPDGHLTIWDPERFFIVASGTRSIVL